MIITVRPQGCVTNVTFRHPAEFVGDQEDGGGVLAVHGAQWFAAILKRVPRLGLDVNLCQEDWGVVFFARRNQKKFWIGLSAWDSDGAWLVHFHHGSFTWSQWFSFRGNDELERSFSTKQMIRILENNEMHGRTGVAFSGLLAWSHRTSAAANDIASKHQCVEPGCSGTSCRC